MPQCTEYLFLVLSPSLCFLSLLSLLFHTLSLIEEDRFSLNKRCPLLLGRHCSASHQNQLGCCGVCPSCLMFTSPFLTSLCGVQLLGDPVVLWQSQCVYILAS